MGQFMVILDLSVVNIAGEIAGGLQEDGKLACEIMVGQSVSDENGRQGPSITRGVRCEKDVPGFALSRCVNDFGGNPARVDSVRGA